MPNTDTLSEALDLIRDELAADRVELAADDAALLFDRYTSGMRYDETLRSSVPVASYKGKPTRKWAHVVICRLDTGRYEPLVYVN